MVIFLLDIAVLEKENPITNTRMLNNWMRMVIYSNLQIINSVIPYAVKMLNSGTDILTVQGLLAHASAEMTMRYARLLDETKREAFENAVNKGVFSFDLNGRMYEISEKEEVPEDVLDMLWRDQKLTAVEPIWFL